MIHVKLEIPEHGNCPGFDPVVCSVCRREVIKWMENNYARPEMVLYIMGRWHNVVAKRITALERKVEWLTSRLKEKKSENCSTTSLSSQRRCR